MASSKWQRRWQGRNWTSCVTPGSENRGADGEHRFGGGITASLRSSKEEPGGIARALVNHPRIVLADEPTGNVDSKVGEEIVRLMRRLKCELGVTVVLVTHDAAIAAQADRVLHLRHGRSVEQET